MKEFMQIIGAEIIDNDWMELTLVPLTLAKKTKPSLLALATGGSMEGIIQAMKEDKIYKTKTYIKKMTWDDMKFKIGTHVSLELFGEKTTGGI